MFFHNVIVNHHLGCCWISEIRKQLKWDSRTIRAWHWWQAPDVLESASSPQWHVPSSPQNLPNVLFTGFSVQYMNRWVTSRLSFMRGTAHGYHRVLNPHIGGFPTGRFVRLPRTLEVSSILGVLLFWPVRGGELLIWCWKFFLATLRNDIYLWSPTWRHWYKRGSLRAEYALRTKLIAEKRTKWEQTPRKNENGRLDQCPKDNIYERSLEQGYPSAACGTYTGVLKWIIEAYNWGYHTTFLQSANLEIAWKNQADLQASKAEDYWK